MGTARARSGHHAPPALGEEDRYHSGGVLTLTPDAGDRRIGIPHWSKGIELLAAIQANVFVDGHAASRLAPYCPILSATVVRVNPSRGGQLPYQGAERRAFLTRLPNPLETSPPAEMVRDEPRHARRQVICGGRAFHDLRPDGKSDQADESWGDRPGSGARLPDFQPYTRRLANRPASNGREC